MTDISLEDIPSLPVLLERAEAAGACDEDLAILRTFDEVPLEHPKAAFWAYWYAIHVKRGRWPEAEPVLRANPDWAYWYTLKVIKGRWIEAEPAIMASPEWAYWYARDVIKERWPGAEPVILAHPIYADWYRKEFSITEGDAP